LDYRAGDEGILITVQDAFDYVAAPDEFRETHRGQSRYREEHIRNIIARELGVPEDRVVPDARFDTDFNAHKIAMQEMVELSSQSVRGLDYRAGDEDMLITVQDAFDYVAAPDKFRTGRRPRH